LKLAILISGRGSNMLAIAEQCRSGALPAEVVLVLADRKAEGISRATAQGLKAQALETGQYHEATLQEAIDGSGANLVVLAGFMRILSPEFVAHYAGRMLNIHPSLLPKYPGLKTHARALAAGDAAHGATVHYVTAELDAGPRLLQGVVKILPGDTIESLSARVHQVEHKIYPQVIDWIAHGRLQWQAGKAQLDGRDLDQPLQIFLE
jgi:phosphoribosylglycinamide formyltransferase 1